MNTMQRISKPLHRASPRARHAVCCAAVAVARAVMQRTSGLLHHALLAPLHCSRPCRARHSRAPLLAPPLPLPSRRAPLLVPPLPLPSRSMPRAPLIAPLIAPSIEDAADRVIGCILLSRAVARRPHLLPPCALCSSTRGECPPNGPLMLAANHARTALTCPHTMQRHPVNRHHRATRTIASHMPAACRRRRYAAVTCPPLVAAAVTPPSHRRRRVAAVASPPLAVAVDAALHQPAHALIVAALHCARRCRPCRCRRCCHAGSRCGRRPAPPSRVHTPLALPCLPFARAALLSPAQPPRAAAVAARYRLPPTQSPNTATAADDPARAIATIACLARLAQNPPPRS
jgi:hypothetical protein